MPAENHADVIVVGVGGIGSAVVEALTRRGLSVLGIERYSVGHDRGSSHGDSRIVRLAYFEHPDYVPLLRAAFDAWGAVERRTGERLVHRTGIVHAGLPESEVLAGVRKSAAEHDLAIENWSAAECRERFPALQPGDELEIVYEEVAGFVEVERATRGFARDAVEAGARILEGEVVRRIEADAKGVRVETDRTTAVADSLVVTAGPWTAELLPELFGVGAAMPLEVRRKVVSWHGAPADHDLESRQLPCFFFDVPGGWFYGFPAIDAKGVKVGDHAGGDVVTSPTTADREVRDAELEGRRAFLASTMPRVTPAAGATSVCFYTMTPDENFVIDRHPEHDRVLIAAGFSGHGYKFAPILGEIAADHLLLGKTEHPVEFLKLGR